MARPDTIEVDSEVLAQAERGIEEYLERMRASGELAENYYEAARRNVFPNLREWVTDPDIRRLSPNLAAGVMDAVREGRWEEIVNAFVREVKFGTGGIRSLMAFRKEDIERLAEEGVDARILKGPNTINNIIVLKCAYGVARYLVDTIRDRTPRVVVGYDSRIQGAAFARIIAETFLAEGVEVFLFDEAVPYPEVTFAIPSMNADAGVFISASHNDYRYNGFKLSGPNGSQFSPEIRDQILAKYIAPAKPKDIHPVDLDTADAETLSRLHFLGGSEPLPGKEYYGRDLIDMHSQHIAHMRRFLLRQQERDMDVARNLKIVYSAFNGAGRRAIPRLLKDLGFETIYRIKSLDTLNGLFPAFKSTPGEEQQPDPGDSRAAVIALRELDREAASPPTDWDPYISWDAADILVATDPDADRSAVIVKPPAGLVKALEGRQRPGMLRYSDRHVLLPADDMWTLILWYRMKFGGIKDPARSFIALSHTTTDMIARLAESEGLGWLKTWVGFGWLSAGVAHAWRGAELPAIRDGRPLDAKPDERGKCHQIFFDTTGMEPGGRTFNAATLEQSNGFSILGGPPPGFPEDDRALGAGGHVRDKDGTFATLLTTEVAAYAKEQGIDLMTLLAREIYANPNVGLFVNYYEPDPFDGEYPGLAGDSKKKAILDNCIALYERAQKESVAIGGREVTDTRYYWTGKYDAANWTGFPDEGLRFYLGDRFSYITVRPSGTSNSLRFHVQLYGGPVEEEQAWVRRLELEAEAIGMIDELRATLGAPREANAQY